MEVLISQGVMGSFATSTWLILIAYFLMKTTCPTPSEMEHIALENKAKRFESDKNSAGFSENDK